MFDAERSRCVSLRIQINEQHGQATQGERRGQVDRGGGLSDTALSGWRPPGCGSEAGPEVAMGMFHVKRWRASTHRLTDCAANSSSSNRARRGPGGRNVGCRPPGQGRPRRTQPTRLWRRSVPPQRSRRRPFRWKLTRAPRQRWSRAWVVPALLAPGVVPSGDGGADPGNPALPEPGVGLPSMRPAEPDFAGCTRPRAAGAARYSSWRCIGPGPALSGSGLKLVGPACLVQRGPPPETLPADPAIRPVGSPWRRCPKTSRAGPVECFTWNIRPADRRIDDCRTRPTQPRGDQEL